MMTHSVVSIIIPVFNGEKFIYESLIKLNYQTFQNFEVIVIDDGSTDSTVVEFQKVKSKLLYKISFYSQSNKGVSVARNLGIDMSSSEYIMFMDIDDEFSCSFVSDMVKLQNENRNKIVLSKVKNINELQEEIFSYPSIKYKKRNLNTYNLLKSILSSKGYGGFVFNKIYINNILKTKNIRFPEGIHYCEDQVFNLRYCKHMNGAVLNDLGYYKRMIHQNSFVQTRKTSKKYNERWNSFFTAKDTINALISEYSVLSDKEKINLFDINILSYRNEFLFLKQLSFIHSYQSEELDIAYLTLKSLRAFSLKLDIKNFILKNYTLKDLAKYIIFSAKIILRRK
jgi:glycosyltransferase involved in cell wall biosynthesis